MQSYFKHKLNNLINVSKIVTIHYLELEKSYATAEEAHDFWEMVYVDKESLFCTANGESIPMRQGEVLFHKPGERHSLAANGSEAPNVFVLCFECRSDAMRFFDGKRVKLDKRLVQLIYLITEEGKKTFDIPFSDPKLRKMVLLPNAVLGGEQLIKNYLEIFLVELLRSEAQLGVREGEKIFFARKSYGKKPVDQTIAVLERGIYESLSVDDICERAAYGRGYLFRVFKATTGKSIMEYYLSLKIERAKQLLREGELSVQEIAATLAFNEPNYFSKTFKRITGLTPSAYKKRAAGL